MNVFSVRRGHDNCIYIIGEPQIGQSTKRRLDGADSARPEKIRAPGPAVDPRSAAGLSNATDLDDAVCGALRWARDLSRRVSVQASNRVSGSAGELTVEEEDQPEACCTKSQSPLQPSVVTIAV